MSSKNANSTVLILSRQQVRSCDDIAIEHFAIPGIVLMENAGSAAARLALSLLKNPAQAHVCIIAGFGNNAGDGFVVARHLANEAVNVDILLCGPPDRFKGDALTNFRIVQNMQLPITCLDPSDPVSVANSLTQHLTPADIVIDAMLGTGASGPPRQPIRTAIETLNSLQKTVIALDIPSGLDCDTGQPLELAVRAAYTITFAARKKGFQFPQAAHYTGRVTVASIGIDTARLLQNASENPQSKL